MNHASLFDPPSVFTDRVRELTKQSILKKEDAQLLLQVELTFILAERLGFDDEPVTALWALLSGMLIRESRLNNLTAEQRRTLANVRQIVPFGPRFSWIAALRNYLSLPDSGTLRSYQFTLTDTGATILDVAKKSPAEQHELHFQIYETCLTATLSFHRRSFVPKIVDVGTAQELYQFTAFAEGPDRQILTPSLNVTFNADDIAGIPSLPNPWLPTSSDKEPFSIDIKILEDVVDYIVLREADLAARYGYKPQNWVKRLSAIDLQAVLEESTSEASTLTIDGFTHIAGMVASGKSTLSMLLAAYLVLYEPHRRMTLVVGDVQSAIRLANQLNSWFREDPDLDIPVAIPLLGRSTRHKQRQGFYTSDDYRQHQERNQPHWGERWLSALCPLQAYLTDTDVDRQLKGGFIKTGKEPCQTLYRQQSATAQNDSSNPFDNTTRRSACPFLPVCPQYQQYRDMPTATIWITTPGAMGISTVPPQLDSRPVKIGEIVYEQSDIVVFDEADTIIQWFDDQYASSVTLTGGQKGLLDIIGIPSERHATLARVMPKGTQRWMGAERSAQQVVTSVLTLLDPDRGPGFLGNWIAKHEFTPQPLCYRIARRAVGLAEYDPRDTPEDVRSQNDQQTETIMQHFQGLLDEPDPLRISRRGNASAPVVRLSQLMQRINSTGENATDEDILLDCENWLTEVGALPDTTLGETITRLAYRLQFALTVALLDRHTRIVFYEWDSRPADIEDASPSYRGNRVMHSLLPLPLTGRQFGTYYARGRRQSDRRPGPNNDSLSLFAYTNVGRYYVLNFHRLLTDFTGQRGPNVLAMSGTSYLEASTTFHVNRPQALLLPPKEATDAIRESTFCFLPQYDEYDIPIRLSGSRQDEKPKLIQKLMASLAGRDGLGHLSKTLLDIGDLALKNPTYWTDRQRILLFVNSYEQARWASDFLRHQWRDKLHRIKHLVSDSTEQPDTNTVRRADIEQFVHTGGQLLVAPLSAVGRGFNILNEAGNAAFGAVYFLTRPYPHPHDTKAVAREVNRRTMDWLTDEDFVAWQEDGLERKAESARRHASQYWHMAESRSYYSTLHDNIELRAYPRQDLAATTLGYIIQAVGRLLRGGVPFKAYFVDAAWGPNWSSTVDKKLDTPKSSLLAAMIQLVTDYVADDFISAALYEPLAYALDNINGFDWEPDLK